jgi:hypothetical protein
VTIPDAVTIQFLPEGEHSIALNMWRIIMQYIYYYRIKELCIKLVIETSLFYDAQSEKHQIPCGQFYGNAISLLTVHKAIIIKHFCHFTINIIVS